MKMTFLKLFIIGMFKDPNLAENLFKKLNSTEFMEFVFPGLPAGLAGLFSTLAYLLGAHWNNASS